MHMRLFTVQLCFLLRRDKEQFLGQIAVRPAGQARQIITIPAS